MKKKKYSLFKERTDSKLRYAQLYLDELKNSTISGSDSEKAHQESFLFHLNGAAESFLAEINEIYDLGIKAKNLSIQSLKNAKFKSKPKSKKPIGEAQKLSKLMGKKNWLSELKSFNPHAIEEVKKGKKTKNKDKDETANLVEQIGQMPTNPVLEKFEVWQGKMRQLILELRESAILASVKSSKK